METTKPDPSHASDTIAVLRDLYRASEARAARLRLLIEASRDLSSVEPDALERSLATNARRTALFAGFRDGEISLDDTETGLPLIAPGAEARRVGTLKFLGEADPQSAFDEEDREALNMLAQLIGAAVDRAARDKEREALLKALQDREQHLEHLVGRLFTAQEDERRYVSRELHDGVAQTATALYRHLDARLSTRGDADSQDVKLANIAKGLVRELRSVIAGLRPTTLDDLGLVSAIEALADDLKSDGYDVSLSVDVTEDIPQNLTTPYFRIAQEALSNIRKHAGGPCRVEITLAHNELQKRWRLHIRDYGSGLKPQPSQPVSKGQHVGMEMMRERMIAIGGTLDIDAADPGVSIIALVETTQ